MRQLMYTIRQQQDADADTALTARAGAARDRQVWAATIIQDELSKPLQVNKVTPCPCSCPCVRQAAAAAAAVLSRTVPDVIGCVGPARARAGVPAGVRKGRPAAEGPVAEASTGAATPASNCKRSRAGPCVHRPRGGGPCPPVRECTRAVGCGERQQASAHAAAIPRRAQRAVGRCPSGAGTAAGGGGGDSRGEACTAWLNQCRHCLALLPKVTVTPSPLLDAWAGNACSRHALGGTFGNSVPKTFPGIAISLLQRPCFGPPTVTARPV